MAASCWMLQHWACLVIGAGGPHPIDAAAFGLRLHLSATSQAERVCAAGDVSAPMFAEPARPIVGIVE
jgi:hypothetical protein